MTVTQSSDTSDIYHHSSLHVTPALKAGTLAAFTALVLFCPFPSALLPVGHTNPAQLLHLDPSDALNWPAVLARLLRSVAYLVLRLYASVFLVGFSLGLVLGLLALQILGLYWLSRQLTPRSRQRARNDISLG